MYSRLIKPVLDRIIAIIVLVVLSPAFSVLILSIWLIDGSPVFFVQRRSGFLMKIFNLYKFRTLQPTGYASLSMENRRPTNTGQWLRRTGLDELPQLVNIIKGDMSFVGPRPLPEEYNEMLSEIQKSRFRVKPGITGWAQVNGRNNQTWAERFAMDEWYVNHQSLLLDVKIIALTIGIMLKFQPEVSMPVFKGSN